MKIAVLHFEANPQIGAGHAIRSSVLADLLIQQGWHCAVVTTKTTYDFIKSLERFQRIDPEYFQKNTFMADLSIFDHYQYDLAYEQYYRKFSKKILVIDDLANRMHDCDLLLDQTYGRPETDYKLFVPQHCRILTGSEYALLRPEFAQLRPKALEKRQKTKEIQRVCISMGGSDTTNQTEKALHLMADTGFLGAIDIVLGFQASHEAKIKEYCQILPNHCTIHHNPNMAQLYYEADLAIGAAGSSVWERLCLGLPQFIFQLADNQSLIFKTCSAPNFYDLYQALNHDYAGYCFDLQPVIDGFGAQKNINIIFS